MTSTMLCAESRCQRLLSAHTGCARLIVGMPVGPRKRMPPAGTVRRKGGSTQADGEEGLILAHYHGPVSGQRVPGGVVHKLPADLNPSEFTATQGRDPTSCSLLPWTSTRSDPQRQDASAYPARTSAS